MRGVLRCSCSPASAAARHRCIPADGSLCQCVVIGRCGIGGDSIMMISVRLIVSRVSSASVHESKAPLPRCAPGCCMDMRAGDSRWCWCRLSPCSLCVPLCPSARSPAAPTRSRSRPSRRISIACRVRGVRVAPSRHDAAEETDELGRGVPAHYAHTRRDGSGAQAAAAQQRSQLQQSTHVKHRSRRRGNCACHRDQTKWARGMDDATLDDDRTRPRMHSPTASCACAADPPHPGAVVIVELCSGMELHCRRQHRQQWKQQRGRGKHRR